MRKSLTPLLLISGAILLFVPLITMAQNDYVPLTKIPGITDFTDATSLVNGFIRIVIVAAGLLAVLQIVRGGFVYLTTEAVSAKGDAKKLISDALTGLLLVLVSIIILSVINPDILNVRFLQNTPALTAPVTTTGSGGNSNTNFGGVQPFGGANVYLNTSQPLIFQGADAEALRTGNGQTNASARAANFREACLRQNKKVTIQPNANKTQYTYTCN